MPSVVPVVWLVPYPWEMVRPSVSVTVREELVPWDRASETVREVLMPAVTPWESVLVSPVVSLSEELELWLRA